MNKVMILSNLVEAAEQLRETIAAIKSDPEYGEEEFLVEISHVYYHLNYAWNGRHGTDEEGRSAAHVDKWKQFPDAADLFL